MERITALGLGRILAVVGLILVVVLIVVSHMEFIPLGLLFLLAFAAILL